MFRVRSGKGERVLMSNGIANALPFVKSTRIPNLLSGGRAHRPESQTCGPTPFSRPVGWSSADPGLPRATGGVPGGRGLKSVWVGGAQGAGPRFWVGGGHVDDGLWAAGERVGACETFHTSNIFRSVFIKNMMDYQHYKHYKHCPKLVNTEHA